MPGGHSRRKFHGGGVGRADAVADIDVGRKVLGMADPKIAVHVLVAVVVVDVAAEAFAVAIKVLLLLLLLFVVNEVCEQVRGRQHLLHP